MPIIIIIIIIITLALRRAYLLLLFCGRKSAARAKNTNQKSKLQTVGWVCNVCVVRCDEEATFFESLAHFLLKVKNPKLMFDVL
tara:strand:- start:1302 stop:1553 length:252 start_codon:yes stop_codon:yes gene_type:complete